jgi:hypothetical protein
MKQFAVVLAISGKHWQTVIVESDGKATVMDAPEVKAAVTGTILAFQITEIPERTQKGTNHA